MRTPRKPKNVKTTLFKKKKKKCTFKLDGVKPFIKSCIGG